MTVYPYNIVRGDWEESGYTIAEHTSSPPLDWSQIVGITIHYPADPSIRQEATRPNLINHLQASQRWYVANRDYSYGYNAVVWDGISAEVRGDGFRCAANGNTILNRDKFAIQIRVEGQTTSSADTSMPATDADIAEVQRLIAWAESQAGRELVIEGHRDLKPTGCPGDAIYQQIQAGVFAPPVVTPPPPEVPDMSVQYFTVDSPPPGPLFATDGLHVSWISGPQAAARGGISEKDGVWTVGGNVIQVVPRDACIQYSFVGQPPEGYAGIWGTSERY